MVTFILHRTYVVWSWIIAAAVVVQVFLAGLYVFGSTSIEAHIINGSFLLFATLLGGIFALVARTPRRVAGASWVLFCLVVMQVVLIEVGTSAGVPVLKALHPVNALVIFTLSGMLAVRSRAFIERRSGVAPSLPLARRPHHAHLCANAIVRPASPHAKRSCAMPFTEHVGSPMNPTCSPTCLGAGASVHNIRDETLT